MLSEINFWRELQAWANRDESRQGLCTKIKTAQRHKVVSNAVANRMLIKIKRYAWRNGRSSTDYLWQLDSVGMSQRAAFCERQIDRLTKTKTSKTGAKRVQRSKKDAGAAGKAAKTAGRSGRGASRKRSD